MKQFKFLLVASLLTLITFSFSAKKANCQIVQGVQMGLDILGNISSSIGGLEGIDWLNASQEALMLKKIYELNKEIENARRNVEWIKKIETFEKMENALSALLCTTYELNQYKRFYTVGVCGNNLQFEITMMNLQQARDMMKLILDVGNALTANDRANAIVDATKAIEDANKSMNDFLDDVRDTEYESMRKQYIQNQKASAISANPNKRFTH